MILLRDWPEGQPAMLGSKRRELIVGEKFTFVGQSAPLTQQVKLLAAPKGAKATVSALNAITVDRPGLWAFDVLGVRCEAVAFLPEALKHVKTVSSNAPPNLVLRVIANMATHDQCELMSLEPDAKWADRHRTDPWSGLPEELPNRPLFPADDGDDRNKFGALLPCPPP